MQEQLICRHVPIRGYLVKQPDGSYELDPERSTYADIPADAIARFLIEKLAPGALKVNCVIVKDLSRLGQEYIDTGRYLQQIFPAYGVRFISINDNIDTANQRAGDDLTIGLKNMINDAYCHDISVKTRSALKAKREKGDYVGACPIYSYQKDPENRNRLVIDEDAARVVRDIYRRKIDGASAKRIATELNRLGVLSPSQYKINRGLPHPTGGFADVPGAKWSAKTVLRILQDETYTGVLLQGKQETYNHKLKNIISKPAEEWVRTEDAHDPIIPRRDFDLVQKILSLDTRTAPDGSEVYLFSGLLICGCCGGPMTRKIAKSGNNQYIYYYCPTGRKRGCDSPVMVREDALTVCVLESLQGHIQSVIALDKLLDSMGEDQINRELVAGYTAQIRENEVQLDKARDAFSGITKIELPNHEDIAKLDFGTQMLYHALVVEAFLPIRVVLGYDGFASEYSLREKFCEYLTKAQKGTDGAKGFGATSLPNLIIAGENSLIKTNGMPYAITTDTNEYCWIASYRCKSLLLLLELLWTRLTYKFAISSSVFGNNFQIENLAPLLLAKAQERGWEYKVIPYSKAELEKMGEASDWNPTFVTDAEFVLVNELCQHDVTIDTSLKEFVTSKGENLQQIIAHLMDERLITQDGIP